MKIATWNINSVRLRLPSIKRFLEEAKPDILCLQETKVEDHKFPKQAFLEMGYPYVMFRGEKSYNGVAIISKLPLSDDHHRTVAGVNDRRHLCVTLPGGIELHNFYVPAGGDEPDPDINPKFNHKLRFMEDIAEWFTHHRSQKTPIILVGDLNIAPLEQDVWSHKQLLNVVSHTPIEVEKMASLQKSLDWVDAPRYFVPETEKLYSWWSYRNRDWKKSNRGRRLDHIWVTPALKPSLKSHETMSFMRDWEKPSDHVPVVVELTL